MRRVLLIALTLVCVGCAAVLVAVGYALGAHVAGSQAAGIVVGAAIAIGIVAGAVLVWRRAVE